MCKRKKPSDVKETQPHKSFLFVFFFCSKKFVPNFNTFTHNNNKDKTLLLAHKTYVGFRDLQRHETQNQGPTEAKLKGQEELPSKFSVTNSDHLGPH